MAGMRIDYVVAAFRDDFGLLRLQARSMARFLDAESTGTVFVVNNDRDQEAFARRFERAVRPEYGALAGRVELVPAAALLAPEAACNGYWRQQAIKLRAHAIVRESAYVTLDCKNILIRPLAAGRFRHKDGRLVAPQRALREHLSGGLRYFGLPPEAWPEWLIDIYTPVPMWRDQCAALEAHVRAREGFGLDMLMARHSEGNGQPRLYEFLLYGAWLHAMAGGIEAHHAFLRGGLSTTYMCKPQDQPPDNVLAETRSERFPIMGVHRRTAEAPEAVRRAFAEVWRCFGLVESEEEGLAMLTSLPWRQAEG